MNEGTTNTKPKGRSLKAATLVMLLAMAALLITNPAKAARPIFMQFNFGMVGITRTQTARLSMFNGGREPINLSLNFTDSAGKVMKQSFEMVEGGHAIFLDLSHTTVDAGAGRLQIHASIEASGRGGDGSRQVIPTLEVFDNETGKTQVVLCACDGSV